MKCEEELGNIKADVLAGSLLKMKKKRQMQYTVIQNEVK